MVEPLTQLRPREKRDAKRLWDAMLAVFPVVVGHDVKSAPQGHAHIARECAQVLLDEWKRASVVGRR